MKRGLLLFGLLLGAMLILGGCGNINEQYDVVVVGGGTSGMSAALEANANGARVLLIEQDAILGGNSRFDFDGMNAAGTTVQSENGIEDSVEQYQEDIGTAADHVNNQNLSAQMALDSNEVLEWVNEQGAGFTQLIQMPGSSVARTHKTERGGSAGLALVNTLETAVNASDITVMRETQVLKITPINIASSVNTIEVRGVNNNTKTITGKTLILANEDIGDITNITNLNDPDALSQASFYEDTPQTLSYSLKMIKDLNLDVFHYGQRDIYDTFATDANQNVPVTVRTLGGILVNTSGKRFVNEIAPRDEVAAEILRQPTQDAYLIFNDEIMNKIQLSPALKNSGYIYSADNIDDLAKRLDMDPVKLKETMKAYGSAVESKSDSAFNRDLTINGDLISSLQTGTYYAVKVHPVSYVRSTGVKVTNISQPSISGQIVPGLFIAGDFPGGTYGDQQLYGDDLTQSVIFGRHAAQSAVEYINGE